MKLRCLLGHNRTGWRQSSGGCSQINMCLRCYDTKRRDDKHDWSTWSDVEDERWVTSNSVTGVKIREYTREVQTRKCTVCNLTEKRCMDDTTKW